ncbi:MAG TPA: SDR family NAD(P)-dependent oxidoreductase [Acidimicrobiales bacterium]|nr:SDR family NAD(P)-dependent oxidoreductase [Acidimicrobiales bacterium]
MHCSAITAVVSGAASGLGAATARELAARGATVVGIDLTGALEHLGTPAGSASSEGVRYVAADVTDEAQLAAALDVASGIGPPLRVAVNCAGIARSGRILTKEGPHPLELFQQVVAVNLVGTFNVLRLAAQRIAATPALQDGQRGVVVNTASVAAFEGQVGQIAYAASKAGVAGMTICAARDLARHGIRVVTIAPGIVDTPMLGSLNEEFRAGLAASVPFPARLASPAEYAELVAMIVEHDYLNGETIRMDGALRMAPR